MIILTRAPDAIQNWTIINVILSLRDWISRNAFDVVYNHRLVKRLDPLQSPGKSTVNVLTVESLVSTQLGQICHTGD